MTQLNITYAKNTTYAKINQQYIQKRNLVQFPLNIKSTQSEDPMKSLLSV